jgi:hypothetical protein
MSYERKKWEESEALRKQQEALEAYKATKPGEYSSPNQQLSEEALKNWQNYKPFNFDINRDALYNQYKNNYMTQGKLAMQDTMGQAAALTGGYGNSYANTAGNQVYQGYLTKLNEVVPALQDAAYNRYLQGKNDAYNNWQVLQSKEAQDYSRYMDSINRFNAEYDRLYNEYQNAYNKEYSQFQYDDQMGYQQYQDALAQENWQKQFDADQAYRNWQISQASAKAATPTIAAFDNGKVGANDIKQLQKYLGMPETGYWDEASFLAAGGLTADQAWSQFNNTYLDGEGAVGRQLQADDSYVNNYWAQTSQAKADAYQYSQGMYNPVLLPTTQGEADAIYNYVYEFRYGAAQAEINRLAAEGKDVAELQTYLDKARKNQGVF